MRVIHIPPGYVPSPLTDDSKALGDGRAMRWKEPESLDDCVEQRL